MPMPRPLHPALAACIVLAALAASTLALPACDSAPGLPELAPLPRLSGLEVTPTAFAFESDAATAELPLVVRAELSAPATVRALVRFAEADTLAAQAETETTGGAVELAVPLALPRGATGDYRVTVVTEASDGRPGDQAEAVFTFQAESLGPPTVTAVDAPAAVAPGGTLPVVATVTDPDGLANVALVLLQDETGAFVAQLFDEGSARSDDDAAGDGRFSETLRLGDGAEPGDIPLQVVAFDRAGTASEPAAFTVTVQ